MFFFEGGWIEFDCGCARTTRERDESRRAPVAHSSVREASHVDICMCTLYFGSGYNFAVRQFFTTRWPRSSHTTRAAPPRSAPRASRLRLIPARLIAIPLSASSSSSINPRELLCDRRAAALVILVLLRRAHVEPPKHLVLLPVDAAIRAHKFPHLNIIRPVTDAAR